MESGASKALGDIDEALTRLISEIDVIDRAVREVDKKMCTVKEGFARLGDAVYQLGSERCNYHVATKRSHLPAKVAAYAFIVFSLALLGGVLVYFGWGRPKDAIEYSSFSFGCTAAITAGLTTYFERYRTPFFFVSFFMLCLSALTFVESHSQSSLVVSVSLWIICGVVFIIYGVYRVSAVLKALRGAGWSWSAVMSILGSFLILSGLFALVFYLYSFLSNNFNCINDFAPLNTCQKIWRFW